MTKKRQLLENTLYDWLMNYISEPIKGQWDSAREKIGSLLKTNTRNTNRSEKKLKHLKRLHDQLKMYDEREKEIKREFVDPISSNRNLLGDERHIPVKTIKISDGPYIQYDSDSDAYFKVFSTEECLEKMKTHFIYITEGVKSLQGKLN